MSYLAVPQASGGPRQHLQNAPRSLAGILAGLKQTAGLRRANAIQEMEKKLRCNWSYRPWLWLWLYQTTALHCHSAIHLPKFCFSRPAPQRKRLCACLLEFFLAACGLRLSRMKGGCRGGHGADRGSSYLVLFGGPRAKEHIAVMHVDLCTSDVARKVGNCDQRL